MPRKFLVGAAFVAVVLGWAKPAHSEPKFLEVRTVTTVGLVDIAGDNLATAREAAIRQAIRNAVEEVMGFVVESTFTAEQKEVVKDGQAKFTSTVEDRILTRTSGFVESHRVISAKQKGQQYRAVVEVVVKANSLHKELNQLEAVLAAAGYPKIVLLIAEAYTDRTGKRIWLPKPVATAFLEKALLEKKLELLAAAEADALRRDLGAMAALVGDDAKVAAFAAKVGADVAVVGLSDVRFSGHNEMGANLTYLSARLSLRAVRGLTGKVLASFEVEGKGAGVNETQARQQAVKKAAPKAARDLLASLLTAWRAEAERGHEIIVVVHKVKHYRRLARPLMAAIKELAGVEGVEELNFAQQRLELKVRYAGKTDQLAEAIFDQIAVHKPFANLDKVAGDGDRLELSL